MSSTGLILQKSNAIFQESTTYGALNKTAAFTINVHCPLLGRFCSSSSFRKFYHQKNTTKTKEEGTIGISLLLETFNPQPKKP